jgi:hypothetical protein
MEHFRDTATVTEDPGTHQTTISTEPGYVEGSGPLREVWHDEFLTAVIDPETGHASFQIEVSNTYSGARRSYRGADLDGMGGPKSVPATVVRTERVNCATGECIYTDHVRIPVEEALLQRLAGGYRAGAATLFSFKLLAAAGNYRGQLSNAEIAGLLARVDAYRSAPSASGAPAPISSVHAPLMPRPAPPVPRNSDFGISAIAVSPSPDRPERGGILVSAVHAGSVAQKAGLITGDIVFQFNGRPTRSLADLDAAVAANPQHTAATIKLFRGLEELTLQAGF